MPGLVSISEFVDETRDDYTSPITSNFVSRMPQFRNTINTLEEVCYNVMVDHHSIPAFTFPFTYEIYNFHKLYFRLLLFILHNFLF